MKMRYGIVLTVLLGIDIGGRGLWEGQVLRL